MALCKQYILIIEYFLAMDGHRPFGDITNTLNRHKRQLHEEPIIHDVDDGNFSHGFF
jgi:hypothetical protein